jgi:hypothetical protein
MITLLKHRTTLNYLAYLGYPGENRTSALLITRPRKYDRRRGESSRNVFLCYVCGAAGSGKTSLLRSFAGAQFDDQYVPTDKVLSVVNSVDIHGSEKYLVVGRICCTMCLARHLFPFTHSYRSLALNSSLRCFDIPRRLIWPMSLSTFMIQATLIRFRTSVI